MVAIWRSQWNLGSNLHLTFSSFHFQPSNYLLADNLVTNVVIGGNVVRTNVATTSSVTLVTSNNDADAGFKILSKRDEEAERRVGVGVGVDHPSAKVGRSSLLKYKANNRNKVK